MYLSELGQENRLLMWSMHASIPGYKERWEGWQINMERQIEDTYTWYKLQCNCIYSLK